MRSFDTSRRLFLGSFVSVLLLSCPQASGQLGGKIKLYTDTAHTSSAWQDSEDVLYVYVVYENIRESRGCTYRLRNCRHTMQHVEDIKLHWFGLFL